MLDMVSKRKGKLVTVEIDPVLYQRVKQLSKDSGVSLSFKIREALELWADTSMHNRMADVQNLYAAKPRVEDDFDFGA